MQPAPFLIFIIDSRARIVKHKNIAILASQIPLPAPRGYASRGVAFCQFLWYSLSRKALFNQTQAAIAPHRSRCLALRSKASAGGHFLEFRSRRSQRREGCLMTTSEILLLFQTIIALLALLVSVVHLMDDRKKDDSYGSKRKKHKKK